MTREEVLKIRRNEMELDMLEARRERVNSHRNSRGEVNNFEDLFAELVSKFQ